MNLKQRFSLIFSCLCGFVLATVTFAVYHLFAQFRQDEFANRLIEKAKNTAKFVLEVKEIGSVRQHIIDKNDLDDLHNENTAIYTIGGDLVYSSQGKAVISWSNAELYNIKRKRRKVKEVKNTVEVGIYEEINGKGYYLLTSAEDQYYEARLKYLMYLLIGAFVAGTATVAALSFFLSKKALAPLDLFRKRIQRITDGNLKVRLTSPRETDEIAQLAHTFNQMMDRIDEAYNRQREFTRNASHELRTPIARITTRLQNLNNTNSNNPVLSKHLAEVVDDMFLLSGTVSSLVALADINNSENNLTLVTVRLDELLFTAIKEISAMFPLLKWKFDIEDTPYACRQPEIYGDERLLKIAMINILKNAYLYSDNQIINCSLSQTNNTLILTIENTGPNPTYKESRLLFTPFYRGSNAVNVSGNGIGLGIVKRIMDYHQAAITFNAANGCNKVSLTFAAVNV